MNISYRTEARMRRETRTLFIFIFFKRSLWCQWAHSPSGLGLASDYTAYDRCFNFYVMLVGLEP